MSNKSGKKRKSDYLLMALIILLFLIGVGVMIYPDVASFSASLSHAGLIEQYEQEISELSNEVIEAEFNRARKFNESLAGGAIEDPFILGSGFAIPDDYYEIFNTYHAMGVIQIPAINVKLPIFHGTTEDVLIRGVGHIPVTPFPVGQMGKHAVLTGHTGIPVSRLFTDLELLEVGDLFFITIMDQVMAYEIDQITVVLPDEVGDLRNVANEDLVTLVTCTPYAINSHRLLVRGSRIPYEPELLADIEVVIDSLNWRIWFVIVSVSLFIISWFIFLIQSRRKRRKNRK